MRTTININENVLERAKRLASENGQTLSTVIQDALIESFSRREQQTNRPHVKLTTVGGGELGPGLDLDNNAAMLDLMEEGEWLSST